MILSGEVFFLGMPSSSICQVEILTTNGPNIAGQVKIRCPILAIQGFDDEHGCMMQIDRIEELAGGKVSLEKWEDCGHDPFRADPDRMLESLARFLAEVSPPVC